MKFTVLPVENIFNYCEVLYALLSERDFEKESISHVRMPTFAQHIKFVKSKPYIAWYFIKHGDDIVGSAYLSKKREIGVFIFKKFQGMGYGRLAVKSIIKLHPGKLLANINPLNFRSKALFDSLGFELIQNTYEYSNQQ